MDNTTMNMVTKLERIQHTLDEIVQFNATPERGFTRFSYGEEDRQVRDMLCQKMEGLGMRISTDAVGNIRARLEGKFPERPAILAGSHIDTVYQGGKYDGALGVVAALEVARVITENKIELDCPYEVIIFAEEEGSNFGVTTLGSKCMAGECDIDYLKQLVNADGVSAYALMKKFDLDVDNLDQCRIKAGQIKAMLELHIEQSVVLESQDVTIGIVEEIAGRKAFAVKVEGASGHAGATPMNLRHDALVGTSELIAAIGPIVEKHGRSRTVATVGRLDCIPNVSNSIAGEVDFSLEIRDVEESWVDAVAAALSDELESICSRQGLKFEMHQVGASSGVYLSPAIAQLNERIAQRNGYTSIRMPSGAVHDAALLNKVTDVGMIFIPSVGGVSHVPHEYSTPETIHAGCNLLLQAVIDLSKH